MGENVRVTIEVRGGVVRAVYCGDFVDVVLIDWDNQDQEEGCLPEDLATIYRQEPESQMSEETAVLAERCFSALGTAGGILGETEANQDYDTREP
mgnify:CR=1 FL=1